MAAKRVLQPAWHAFAAQEAHRLATEHMEEKIHGDDPIQVYLNNYRYNYGRCYARAQNVSEYITGEVDVPGARWQAIIKKWKVV